MTIIWIIVCSIAGVIVGGMLALWMLDKVFSDAINKISKR